MRPIDIISHCSVLVGRPDSGSVRKIIKAKNSFDKEITRDIGKKIKTREGQQGL